MGGSVDVATKDMRPAAVVVVQAETEVAAGMLVVAVAAVERILGVVTGWAGLSHSNFQVD